ncbi:uncharacterized protein METZ01_LOCUS472463, partial [marine metagenome]
MDLMVIMVIADTQEGTTVIIATTEKPFTEKIWWRCVRRGAPVYVAVILRAGAFLGM